MVETITRMAQRLDRLLRVSMRTVIILVTTMCCCTMLLQVVSRYVFEVAISGLDEITGHMAVWMYLMGAAYASHEGSQINAEMVHLVIKNERALCFVRAIAGTISAVVAGFMVSWSYGYVVWSLKKHEVTPTLQLPTVYFQVAILIGAVIMCYYFIRDTVRLYRKFIYFHSATQ
ncbi:MAG: TRAP transporter small permease [Desulfuromusa sp.]|nr:TRAP transporter small permease [Desulfuromusa sp.]